MHDLMTQDLAADYQDIFNIRGRLYHQAMQVYPGVRASEFLNVIREARITSGMSVLDVPSGGAYLSRYLEGIELVSLETSATFANLASGHKKHVCLYDNHAFPLKDACMDRVLSIAGLHHVNEKERIFSEMRRVVRPGGRIVLADVAGDSYVRPFLDDFVGRYCETGHSGWYFDETTRSELRNAGLNIAAD